MEVRKQVIPFQIDYICPMCEKGNMRPTGKVIYTDPPQFEHKCDGECNHYMMFTGISYPYMDYEDTGNIIMT